MNKRFHEDALRWEAGELTLDELDARHPGTDVRALVEFQSWLATASEAPTPDPGPGWATLRGQLPDRVARRERAQWRVRRSVVAVTAAAMLGGTSIAYAAGVEPVRHEVNSIVKSVTNFFGGDEHGSKNDGNQRNVDQGDRGNTNQGSQGNSGPDGGTTNPGGQGTQGNDGADQGNTGPDRGNTNDGDKGNSGTNQSNSGSSQNGSNQSAEGRTGPGQNNSHN